MKLNLIKRAHGLLMVIDGLGYFIFGRRMWEPLNMHTARAIARINGRKAIGA